MSSDCFWKVASALGSDGGTSQSHMRKGAASSVKNFLKCRHFVSRSHSYDTGGVKLRAEWLAERCFCIQCCWEG